MVELVLREAGWRADAYGTLLPAETLGLAIREQRPRLLWVSVSTIRSPAEFLAEYARLYDTASNVGTAVVVGGRALDDEALRREMTYSAYCDTLRHLVSFAGTVAGVSAP